MLTKEKAMYQTWLVIEGLSNAERELISQDLLEEIKGSMEYDENIKIDFSIPLEKQKLDSKTWKMLDKVIKSAEQNGFEKKNKKLEKAKESNSSNISKQNVNVKDSEELEKIKLENIALSKELERFRDESKELLMQYKEAYEKALEENEKVKKDCDALIQTLKTIPAFVRKIFLRDEKVKLLISGK
ncbi:MAG: hypothetical protein IJ215_00030 [Clostridia bacterium]|nr:hypothetical protein [Clostridia bacterium]